MPNILKSVFKSKGYTISLKTCNNLKFFFKTKINIPLKNKSGVYKIKCDNCAAFYIGQSGSCLLYTSRCV